MVPLGSPASDFSLPGTDGETYSLESFKAKDVLVLIFMCNHCPYVKATVERFIQLQNHFQNQSVQIVGINPNDASRYPDDSFESMVHISKELNFSFPYLCDESQEVAQAYHAVCTPDIFVYNKERKLSYRGRLDDNWKEPKKVTHESLKEAIRAILEGHEVPFDQVPSMGCSIKWKEEGK